MQDRATATELLDAIERFLRNQSSAQQDRWLRFQLLVCANSLGIVRRELEQEEDNVRREWPVMNGLIGEMKMPGTLHETVEALRTRNRELCDRIRAGEFDDPEREKELLAFFASEVPSRVKITAPAELD
jgi:hypothetical protein